jgi:phage-related protein
LGKLKLNRAERTAIKDVQDRYDRDELLNHQLESMKGGLYALRVSLDTAALRTYFVPIGDDRVILKVIRKKTETVPPSVTEACRRRQRDWLERHPRPDNPPRLGRSG